jgi:hypothetical protein
MMLLRVAAIGAALANVAAQPAAPVALHAGDSITDKQLFAYLSLPVHPGDWVRYRVDLAGNFVAIKTIGFGVENIGGAKTLFVETHVHAESITGLPAQIPIGIGTDAILKTYVEGSTFADLAHPYQVVTSAVQIGDLENEIPAGPHETYSALAGAVSTDPRNGTVRSVDPVDMRIGDAVVHATRIEVAFGVTPLPLGGMTTASTVTVWQSPDVPLGTVSISSDGSQAVRWQMIAFGRGYRSAFRKTLDQIRAGTSPATP